MVEHGEQNVNPYDPPQSLPERTRIQWEKGSIRSLFLAWFPLPFLSLVQAYYVMINGPAVLDQTFVAKIPLHICFIVAQFLIGITASSVTIYRFVAVPNGPKGSGVAMEVTLSWAAQVFVWLAYGLIGTWIELT